MSRAPIAACDAGNGSDMAAGSERMNALLIFTDSTRRDFVSAYTDRDRLARTPNLDALARQGCCSITPFRRPCRPSPLAGRC